MPTQRDLIIRFSCNARPLRWALDAAAFKLWRLEKEVQDANPIA